MSVCFIFVDCANKVYPWDHPLLAAIKGRSVDIVDFLLSKGISANSTTCCDKRRNTFLHVACELGYLQISGLLLDHGAGEFASFVTSSWYHSFPWCCWVLCIKQIKRYPSTLSLTFQN